MKKAYIILAYKDPGQIERLVQSMYHESFDFYIHVDLKFDLDPFEYLGDLPNVYFVPKRFKMTWASYRFIEVLTAIMEDLLEMDCYDFISPFSGQDYPLKSPNEIYEYYNQNKNKSFITLVNQDSPWLEECKTRYEKYHLTYFSFKGKDLISKLMNAVLPKRKFPIYEKVYGGPRATWLTLSSEAAKFVIDEIKKQKDINRFFRYTWAPDEFLIPTILMNSPFKEKIIFDSGRHIDWSNGGSNPKIFTVDDYPSLKESNKLYGRKFDIKIDTKILDLIDRHLISKKEFERQKTITNA